MAGSKSQASTQTAALYHPRFPEHWDRCALHSLATWVNGLVFRDISFSSHGLPVIKIAEIKGGISGQTKFTEETFDKSVRVTAGDLLFSWSGQPETSIDAFWWRGPDGWLNQHVFRVVPKDGVDITFLYYLLRYLNRNFVGIARNKQTTGLGHVTKRDLQQIEAARPELYEQRAIAAVLGALDDKIEQNRQTARALERLARAIFRAWFVDFEPVKAKAEGSTTFLSMPQPVFDALPTRFVDSAIGPVPEGWEVKAVSTAFDVNPTRRLRKNEPAPYLDMKNMPTEGHAPDSWIERPFGSGMRFMNGDTLVARITPCLENGKTAFVDFLNDGQIAWGSTEYIVLRPKPPLPPVFAYCLARTGEFRDFAIQNMTGTSGRQRVAPTTMDHFQLAVPDEEVAMGFGETVIPMFDCIRACKDESRKLAEIRDYLLPLLLSGKVRVKGTERALEITA
jgi:type I restriction enzyme, S subunit